MKPKGLLETTIAMCVMNMAGLLFVDPRIGHMAVQYAVFAAIIAVTYLVLWYYWQGKNWARILVLLTGCVAILNLLALPTSSYIANALLVVESIFGVSMLWWLNSTSVKSYFTGAQKLKVFSD